MTDDGRDPATPAEWRAAVATAEACLRLDAAKQYGLVVGGPVVNVDRCVALLEAGRARGVMPTSGEIDDAIRCLIAECRGESAIGKSGEN